ncbi:hypothetical protein B0T14DRAFT_569576 [Immersiella caudata]|uniref:Uncharacterized protein n=1 Tax=Immersiella caudata TaxID=314043 RepID=A0AA39WDT8_9PEZI|nr:hypothetical protein B0T14DRAFT_569576 [Immersiella caudata]
MPPPSPPSTPNPSPPYPLHDPAEATEAPPPPTLHPFQTSSPPPPKTTLRQALFSPRHSPRYVWFAFRITSPFTARKWISRLSIWILVLFRAAQGILMVLISAYGPLPISLIVGVPAILVGGWVVAGCLAVVVREGLEGGARGSYHLDCAIVGMLLAHAGWMFWLFGYIEPVDMYYEWRFYWAPTLMWWILGVMIFGLGWIVQRGSLRKVGDIGEGRV